MNVVLTQNYYNLMNALHNTQDSGVPTEFSNAADVDGGRNIITMKTGTHSNKTYIPSGSQKIIQLGKYGKISSEATPTKAHIYDASLSRYQELNCKPYRYALPNLLSLPQSIRFDNSEIPWNSITFLASEDTTPITRTTTTATEDLVEFEVVTYEAPFYDNPKNLSKNGFCVSLKYVGSANFQMNKIYIVIGNNDTSKAGPILLAGINLSNTVTLELNRIFNLSLGCTSNFA